MRRVLVVGMSGAGKTTAARRVATVLGLPFYEMDALAIGPRWSLAPDPRDVEHWYQLLGDRTRQKTWGTRPDQAVLR